MFLKHIESILSNISIWSVIIPIVIGIFFYSRLNNESQIIFYIVVFAAIPQILKFYIENHKTLNITYNLYTFIEFFLIYILFKNLAQNKKYIYDLSLLIYLIIVVYFILEFGIINSFLHDLVSINNLFYIFWICIVIIEKYGLDGIEYLFDTKNSIFWYITGLLFYSACTLVIFLLWNFIKNHPKSIFTHLWLIHYIFNINMYFSFAIGMYKNKRQNLTNTTVFPDLSD